MRSLCWDAAKARSSNNLRLSGSLVNGCTENQQVLAHMRTVDDWDCFVYQKEDVQVLRAFDVDDSIMAHFILQPCL